MKHYSKKFKSLAFAVIAASTPLAANAVFSHPVEIFPSSFEMRSAASFSHGISAGAKGCVAHPVKGQSVEVEECGVSGDTFWSASNTNRVGYQIKPTFSSHCLDDFEGSDDAGTWQCKSGFHTNQRWYPVPVGNSTRYFFMVVSEKYCLEYNDSSQKALVKLCDGAINQRWFFDKM